MKRKKKKHRAPARKPRKRFNVSVRSNWTPLDWTGGVVATIDTTASLGPGKSVVNRILRDVIKQGLVKVVEQLCDGDLTIDEALAQLVRPEAP